MKKASVLLVLDLLVCGVCQGQPTQLGIDRSAGPARIKVQGEANRAYTVEARDLSSTNWDFLATLSLTNSTQMWFDSASALMPNRLYRAVKLDSPTIESADDFRLIDHQGISHSLYYHTNDPTVKAVVLIFTGNGCTNVQQMVPVINSLTNLRSQGILTWMIDANAADNRSNIFTEATNLHIGIPILHDRAQLVARAFHASTTPEVICIDKIDWRIFYRGTIDDRIGSAAVATTQYYLTNALSNFLAHRIVTPLETKTRGCAITLSSIPTPSYSTDIAPILSNSCVRCHSPGNFAPYAMTNYDSIQEKAGKIRREILAGRMPPWHADPFYQSYTNDFSLSPAQAATLIQWINDGAPRGVGPDPLTNISPVVEYPYAWPSSLGAPSNIITIATQSIPADGTIDYINVDYTYGGPTVWLRAAVLLPGTVSVVHHILAYQRGVDNTLYSFLTGYAPGSFLGAFPTGTGKLLTNGTPLRFQLHYIATGEATNDTSHLGLYTTPVAPSYSLIQSSAPGDFSVPANTNDYQAVAETPVFGNKIRLYEFSPHLHTRGARFKYEAIYPSGHNPPSEVLLSVPYYVFHWQNAYRLAQPKDLEVGTKIRVTAGWDNSIQNAELMELFQDPNNPNNYRYDPNLPVGWGDQTWNEMFIGYFNYSIIP